MIVLLTVHEPQDERNMILFVQVDMTAYVEKHELCFDAILDEDVSNDEVT